MSDADEWTPFLHVTGSPAQSLADMPASSCLRFSTGIGLLV